MMVKPSNNEKHGGLRQLIFSLFAASTIFPLLDGSTMICSFGRATIFHHSVSPTLLFFFFFYHHIGYHDFSSWDFHAILLLLGELSCFHLWFHLYYLSLSGPYNYNNECHFCCFFACIYVLQELFLSML